MAKSSKGSSGDRKPLPFEPKPPAKASVEKPAPTPRRSPKPSSPKPATAKKASIPQVVSQRMARRMALFCGVPSLLGFLTMPAGYLILSHHWLELPNVAVLLVSMGFLGLGVLGLSYGVFSASWDEDRLGSPLGFQEFKLNLGRTIEAWRSGRQSPSP
jgi:hypothetical protein